MDETKAVVDIGSMTVDEAMALYKSLKEKLQPIRGVGAGRKPKWDYGSWDWGKKNWDLAREHGVNYQLVCRKRRELGKAKVSGGKHYPACLGWDWLKSDTEISREVGVNVGSVSRYRRVLGKPLLPRDNHRIYAEDVKPMVIDWGAVDFGRCDYEIARGVGCTREYVRQKRAVLGKPKIYAYELRYNAFRDSFHAVTELSHPEARVKFPHLSSVAFKRYCAKAGIKVVRGINQRHGKYPWDKVDWRLPNLLISKIWGIRNNKVAMWRSNHPVLGKALFYFYQKTGAMPDQYRPLVEAQRALAEEHKLPVVPFRTMTPPEPAQS